MLCNYALKLIGNYTLLNYLRNISTGSTTAKRLPPPSEINNKNRKLQNNKNNQQLIDKNSRSGGGNGGGGLFGSLIGTLERSFSGVVESVDKIANRVAYETPIGNALLVLEGKRRLTPLFGSSLRDLVLDDMRCGLSHMDKRLGKLLTFVSICINAITYLCTNI